MASEQEKEKSLFLLVKDSWKTQEHKLPPGLQYNETSGHLGDIEYYRNSPWMTTMGKEQ